MSETKPALAYCEFCNADFYPKHGSQVYCETARCQRDRNRENHERWRLKAQAGAGRRTLTRPQPGRVD